MKLDGDIIYAVVGEPIGKSKKIVDKSILNIHGAIQSHAKDKRVSLIVLGENSDINSDVPTGIKFIEQLTTGEDGEFNFTADVGKGDMGFEAYIFSEDSTEPVKLSFFCENNNYDIALRSGIFRVDTLAYDLFDEKNSSIRLKCNIEDNPNQTYTLIYGMYKDNVLVHADMFPGKITEDTEKVWTYDTSLSNNIEYDKVSIFLWNSFEGMIPLMDVTAIE